jgi:hypothetical protein
VLHSCSNWLEHSEKWRLRDNEALPKKGALTILDDDESDHEEEGGTLKRRSPPWRHR